MKTASIALAITLLATVLAGRTALAADAPYIDNRSDAASLVRSLYSAINRKEYARAWSYFGETKPAKDFETFVAGFKDTVSVKVITGGVSAEGAAGSTYFSVPVAIAATGPDGSDTVFGGCYTARIVNPQLQETTFAPLHLEKGSLKADPDHSIADAVPASCPDAPVPDPNQALLDKVKAVFAAAHGDECETPPGDDDAALEPDHYTIAYRYKSASEGEPDQQAHLFRFYCSTGAYNESHIYYLYKDLEGLQEQHFAAPELEIRYENNDSEGKLERMTIVGFHSDTQLINSDYDEATRTITDFAKWRGVGDASSSGTWIFRDGEFSLVRYEVDPTYDGEINPQTVVDYETPP